MKDRSAGAEARAGAEGTAGTALQVKCPVEVLLEAISLGIYTGAFFLAGYGSSNAADWKFSQQQTWHIYVQSARSLSYPISIPQQGTAGQNFWRILQLVLLFASNGLGCSTKCLYKVSVACTVLAGTRDCGYLVHLLC
jgi:hypothetical protein